MGDIGLPIYNLTTLCLNGTLPCVDFMDVIMGDIGRPTYSPTIGEELTDRSVERVEVCPPHDHRCQGLGPTLSIFM